MRVAVLGGTTEARRLATQLDGRPGVEVETSLAGVVSSPVLADDLPGTVRVGPLRGVAELAAYLGGFDAAIDATHPFARVVTADAAAAADVAGVPLIVLRRPGWTEATGDDWRRVPTFAAAAGLVAGLPVRTVFLAIGRRELAHFAGLGRHRFVLRMIEAPTATEALPPDRVIVYARGPFDRAGERALFAEHRVGALVTKDSGGDATAAKLVVARELELPVIMISRPPVPAGVTVRESVEAALDWVVSLSR